MQVKPIATCLAEIEDDSIAVRVRVTLPLPLQVDDKAVDGQSDSRFSIQ